MRQSIPLGLLGLALVCACQHRLDPLRDGATLLDGRPDARRADAGEAPLKFDPVDCATAPTHDIALVEHGSPACGGRPHSYCTLQDALAGMETYVCVTKLPPGNPSGAVLVRRRVALIANQPGGANLERPALHCESLNIDPQLDVLVRGFKIQGTVMIGAGSTVKLERNEMDGPGDKHCWGVHAKPRARVTLSANSIVGYEGGAVRLEAPAGFELVNNVIAFNGDRDSPSASDTPHFGALLLEGLEPAANPMRIVHNTIVRNKGPYGMPGALRCDSCDDVARPVQLWNSIILLNNREGQAEVDPPFSPASCALADPPLDDRDSNQILESPCFNPAELFQAPSDPDFDFHLSPNDCTKQYVDGKASLDHREEYDFDGDPRGSASPEIGADELR